MNPDQFAHTGSLVISIFLILVFLNAIVKIIAISISQKGTPAFEVVFLVANDFFFNAIVIILHEFGPVANVIFNLDKLLGFDLFGK